MEEKVTYISHNMALLMVDLVSNIESFRKDVGYNSEIISKGKLKENEDPEKESIKRSRKRSQVLVPLPLHNLYLKWK
jgi:hypothetical protein